ncbi:MAG: hypothetical protein GY865_04415 [candidate division Zixibacteria bacterium]|nr:hypothetical protein [candidate division Zixibacteria bacterium]
MKKAILFFAVLIICLVNVASAQKITLKKNIFGGWKYSIDNDEYRKVGNTGAPLYLEFEDNNEALNELTKYKTNKTLSLITGMPGGWMVGWAAGKALADKYEDSDKTLLQIGVPLCIISTIFEIVSDGHLKKAARFYNGEEEKAHFGFDIKREFAFNTNLISYNLTYSF